MEIELGKKGQATVTDTIFFLLIVSGICVFMFAFSTTYGEDIGTQISNQYFSDFSSDALKTILYSSVPRHPDDTLETAEEVDHLLALVKEDFAANYAEDDADKLSDPVKAVLAENIKNIMAPVSSNYDYIFYIFNAEVDEPIFVFVRLTPFEQTPVEGEHHTATATPRDHVHVEYFCMFSGIDFIEKLSRLVLHVGNTSEATGKMQFYVPPSDVPGVTISASSNLIMWVTTDFVGDRDHPYFSPGEDEDGWNCCLYISDDAGWKCDEYMGETPY